MILNVRWNILLLVMLLSGIFCGGEQTLQAEDSKSVLRQENLVAWCIVPFDDRDRTSEQRAIMLKKLGIRKFAYDYRAKHVPHFEEEILACKKQGIEMTAWWFPGALNPSAKHMLSLFEKHKITPQLWISGGGAATKTPEEQQARIAAEVARIRPIAEAAARINCRVELYNHGGWFGEPENQIAIIKALKMQNVGIVYNLHHGHEHLERFEELLQTMLPYLDALNLNGMVAAGDQAGKKILPLGAGNLDLELLSLIQNSGYTGPIGILNHTQEDAEKRLQDNLNGLAWLKEQLSGKPASKKPEYKTFPGTAVDQKPAKQTSLLEHPADYSAGFVKKVATDSLKQGNAIRGVMVFSSMKYACLSCHQVGKQGGTVGPALTKIGKDRTVEQIIESVFWPKREVKPEFVTHQVLTADGLTLKGYHHSEDDQALSLKDASTGKVTRILKDDIEFRKEAGTLMPENVMKAMSVSERRDLIRFLSQLGHEKEIRVEAVESLLAHAMVHVHGATKFTYDLKPLDVQESPGWQENVNRDRIYDFYTKQARHFLAQTPRAHLVQEFPGLDGGQQGHWGNQNEAVWTDDRWNRTDVGSLQAGVFRNSGKTVSKGVCVRFGEQGEMAACFNPETLAYETIWKDGFLEFSSVRHGFMAGLKVKGAVLESPKAAKPDQPFVYHGYYRHGARVIFAYRLGDTEFLDSPWVEDGKFQRIVGPRAEHPLIDLVADSHRQWPEVIETEIEHGNGAPYAVDHIKLPFDNRWNALVFAGGHAFDTKKNIAYVCTMTGDVWQVTDYAYPSKTARWKRFASGLHQPLGMVIDDEGMFVLGRDQITRLHDRNGDGEADFYECFSSVYATSPGGHDYICGLQRDAQGRFYTASGNQGIIRISRDGKEMEVLATGFRNPDGIGLTSQGTVTVPCSEGTWTPSSMICAFRLDNSVNQWAKNFPIGGHQPPYFGFGGPRDDRAPDLPLVYLPRGLDNSSGGQVQIPENGWGNLSGPNHNNMIHTSFGAGKHFLLLQDEVAGQLQGAVVPMPGEFRSGAHRGRFNPHDGQLYISGMAGWGSYTPDDGHFDRVRYTGDKVQQPVAFHVHENGVLLTFSQNLDAASASDAQSHFAQCWNYRYGGGYGSPEFSTKHMGMRGHDVLKIRSAHVLASGRQLFLEIPEIQPVNQLHLYVAAAKGVSRDLFLTVHALDKPFTKFPGYQAVEKMILPHPILADLNRTTKVTPNPWSKRMGGTKNITIKTGTNLSFQTKSVRVKAGEAIEFTLMNPDVVPHNWVLVQPGALRTVGEMSNHLVADPDAILKQYVPESEEVIVYSNIVYPGDEFTIYFRAPKKPGRYPFLCTFPGHWLVMNGEMIVE